MEYGRPDWSVVAQPEYTVGWNYDKNGWWYADTKTITINPAGGLSITISTGLTQMVMHSPVSRR